MRSPDHQVEPPTSPARRQGGHQRPAPRPDRATQEESQRALILESVMTEIKATIRVCRGKSKINPLLVKSCFRV